MFHSIDHRVNVSLQDHGVNISLYRASCECFTLYSIMRMFHSIEHRVNVSLYRASYDCFTL